MIRASELMPHMLMERLHKFMTKGRDYIIRDGQKIENISRNSDRLKNFDRRFYGKENETDDR